VDHTVFNRFDVYFLPWFVCGKHVIPFGWDFLVIGIFSLIIMYLAVISRSTRMVENFKMHQLAEPAAAL